MKISLPRFGLPAIGALLLTLSACGGDGGGGGSDGFTPSLPPNALRVTQANAGDVASSAVGSLDSVTILTDATTGLKSAARPALAEILQWTLRRAVREHFFAARSVSEDCGPNSSDGRITGEVSDSSSTVDSELRFEQCNLAGSGLVLDGQINLEGSVNNTSGAFNIRFNAQIVVTFGAEPPVTLTFDAHQVGNEISGQFTLDFSMSVSGPPDTGFLMESTDDLVGNANLDEIYDGTIMLYGAGNTRLRIDVIATDFVDIDIDEGSGVFEDYDQVDLDSL